MILKWTWSIIKSSIILTPPMKRFRPPPPPIGQDYSQFLSYWLKPSPSLQSLWNPDLLPLTKLSKKKPWWGRFEFHLFHSCFTVSVLYAYMYYVYLSTFYLLCWPIPSILFEAHSWSINFTLYGLVTTMPSEAILKFRYKLGTNSKTTCMCPLFKWGVISLAN